ncbi:MAG: hypothetical protein GY948_15925 [Alphaproteobacteria bacterium]|nr:hypothetical protein [Alphaproteobacteria bacterium]
MKRFTPQIWAAIQADYKSGARSVQEIASYYKISKGSIYKHRKKDGWTKTNSALPAIPLTVPELEPVPPEGEPEAACRERLTPRLTKLLERTVAEIELAASVPEDKPTSMDRARDVRTLGTVVRLLDQLEHTPANTDPFTQTGESDQDEDLIRQEIAERLGRLQDAGRTV